MSTFSIKDGFEQMDFDAVTNLLTGVYWSKGIKKDEVVKGASNSALLVGTFDEDHQQIGYARVTSDKTRFAYIMDVVVEAKHRKKGIGQAMVKHILNHPDLQDVYQWLLITKDAHGVYQKLGFKPVATPDDWMEIRHNRPNRYSAEG
jgi:N-acetylglutamate synthase-like GNAT family acetyltransferase